jgi:hypothetical protein
MPFHKSLLVQDGKDLGGRVQFSVLEIEAEAAVVRSRVVGL